MKKVFITSLVIGLFVVTSMAQANVERVEGSWTIEAPIAIEFSCGGNIYSHTLNTVSQDDDGNLVGTGTYDANTDYTWDFVGNISGDDITFTITYTGVSAGSVYNGVGMIAEDGSVAGTVDSNCQSFSMPADTLSSFDDNHGQYVKSQEDKESAAHSRVGMPTQSMGHTTNID